MAIDIVVPRLGWTMETGVFLRWLKQDGDQIQAGDMLFELEGEKAIQEVEATDAGILRVAPDAPQPGATVPVGARLGCLAAEGEVIDWGTKPGPVTSDSTIGDEIRFMPSTPLPPAPPSVRRLAREMRVDPTRVVCRDPAGRLSAADVLAATGNASQTEDRIISSPRARRVAAELGVDWTQLRGSGTTGRVREREVRLAAQSGTHTLTRHAPTAALPEQVAGRLIPLTALRKTIAARMVAAVQTTAPVTLTATSDATQLVTFRQQLKNASTDDVAIPTYNDILLKLLGTALQQHPFLNAQWRENGILIPDAIHIALAIQTDAGLVAPVIRNVPELSIDQIAATTRDLITAARDRKLAPEQLQGGTFTLTNLGSFGIEHFTPIINLPQCAILGVGQIRREPVVVEDTVTTRDRLPLSLTFDHRIIDGAPAASFLQTVCSLIGLEAKNFGIDARRKSP